MLKNCFTLLFILLNTLSSAQKIELSNSDFRPVRTISPLDEDFSDLQFLKEVFKDKRIILLGEQSHGEGATFEAKVRLIKFLHKEMGFDMLSFESGLYENYKTYAKIEDTNYTESPLKESIYQMWSDTKEFEPLLKYIHETKRSNNPLLVTGFDCQEELFFQNEFLADLKKLFRKNTIQVNDTVFTKLEEVILGDAEFIATNSTDSIAFFNAVKTIDKAFAQIKKTSNSINTSYLHQIFDSWVGSVEYAID
jgi:erythromycin esterase-like protein